VSEKYFGLDEHAKSCTSCLKGQVVKIMQCFFKHDNDMDVTGLAV